MRRATMPAMAERPPSAAPGPASGRARIPVAHRAEGLGDRLGNRLGQRLIGRPTRRRAGVFRRALRREVGRLREPRRVAAIAILVVVFALTAAGLVARGEAGGADARAYWGAVRFLVNGGDPYHPTGPYLPYVYPPWLLPLFGPWALLPWDVAWFAWRGGTVLLLLWTIDWAYRRRPLATAVTVALLAFPIAANLDTGNIDLVLTLGLWAAQFAGPPLAGLLWALATWTKWLPLPLWLVLAPRARGWGLVWLAVSAVLSVLLLPFTIVQLQALFGFGPRPIRLDYLVFLWALVPWAWRHPGALWWTRPASWRGIGARTAGTLRRWRRAWREEPAAMARRTRLAVRRLVGLEV
jgi:hypothetical protein